MCDFCGAMNEELKKDYEAAIGDTLEAIGVECDFADRRLRRGIRGNKNPKTGEITYLFNEVFPVKEGDIFTDVETEIRYEVLEKEAVGSDSLRVIARAVP
jgi:hypothetical protein